MAARFNPQRSQLMTVGYVGAGGFGGPLAVVPAAAGYVSDKALKAIQNKAAKNAMAQIASGRIPRPRSNQAWQALVQAEAEALRSQAEQQYQESQVAP
jgi:hypothetical protein